MLRYSSQPTLQYGQMVAVVRSGRPSFTDIRLSSAPVGQCATHAPHDSQRAWSIVVSAPATMRRSYPRYACVQTKRPCTSAHARTQRVHMMHLFLSTQMNGFGSLSIRRNGRFAIAVFM